jgi:hypothetical protein
MVIMRSIVVKCEESEKHSKPALELIARSSSTLRVLKLEQEIWKEENPSHLNVDNSLS